MNKVKIKNVLTVVSFLVLLVIASTLAYFTSSDVVTNRFTGGNLDLEIVEPSYSDFQAMAYKQKIDKDPCIENNGKNSAIVFMQVSFPKKSGLTTVGVSGDSETLIQHNATDYIRLFDFYTGGEKAFNTEYWYEISHTSSNDSDTYVYAYRYVLSNDKTADHNITKPLFDKVQLVNIFEPDETQYNSLLYDAFQKINIKAYGIQSEYLTKKDGAPIVLNEDQQNGAQTISDDDLNAIHQLIK